MELIKHLVIILCVSAVIVLFLTFLSTGIEKQEKDKIEPKQDVVQNIVHEDVQDIHNCYIDSQEVAYGYLKSNGVLKDITN
jgi:uncharacterized membrane protein